MRIFLQRSVQQGWEGMRLGSANNHIFHISDAYNTHLPGDLPDPEIEPASLALAGKFIITEPPGNARTPS